MTAEIPPRPATLTEKILARHALGPLPSVITPGASLRLRVDFTLASELAWNGMNRTYERLGRPDLYDRERFYIALDHTVDPQSLAHDPKTQRLVQLARQLRDEHRLPHFFEPNTTILHTTFYRDFVQPGQLILGADSHTTSHGALGAFAIGLGGADVLAAMLSGETWLEVPQCLEVRYVGSPSFGVLGKDMILATLQQLGRNTLALERAVEFTGDVMGLSLDTRFAICNMTAELGGLCGLFEADARARAWLATRPRSFDEAVYERADAGAEYAARVRVDLTGLLPKLAEPFSPDNVVDVAERTGLALDGCFVGACTTTEEELVLAGLLLERAWASGMRPEARDSGRRLLVPGNREIASKLQESGLLTSYERAGFVVDPPGCSMCLGVASRRAGAGETWLSSQNRNFPNRMGAGSLAYLASACTVAASAFEMKLRDPSRWFEQIDRARLARILAGGPGGAAPQVTSAKFATERSPLQLQQGNRAVESADSSLPQATQGSASISEVAADDSAAVFGKAQRRVTTRLQGRVQRFGDAVDTDAIIAGEFCHLQEPAELGRHCLKYVRPDFVTRVGQGQNIVVAGQGWVSGSSREQAVWALQGAGVQLVIARSFAFIHKRNLVNEAFPFLELADPAFYDLAVEGRELSVDFDSGEVLDVESGQVFSGLPPRGAARRLFEAGGLIATFERNEGSSTRFQSGFSRTSK
ncbi:MAG TPA: aconitase family protein [Polyangiaceae bacterium]|nr:aconitase family protein [Polyangiaceae bacterium]